VRKRLRFETWEGHEGSYCEDNVNCYTVAELGEMLPSPAGNYLGRKRFKCGWDEEGWYIELLALPPSGGTNTFHGTTEAEARAKALIHLIENKLHFPEATEKLLTLD
jgi:hypothetical protein